MAADTLRQTFKRVRKTSRDAEYLIKKGFKVTPVIEKARAYLSSAVIDRLYMEFKTYHKDDRAALSINFTNYTPIEVLSVYDDFDDREETNGWGIAHPGGLDWDVTGSFNSAAQLVTDGRGILQPGTSTSTLTQIQSPVITAVTEGDRTIRARVKFSGVTGYSGSPSSYQTLFHIRDIEVGVYVELLVRVSTGAILAMSDVDAVYTSTPIVGLVQDTYYNLIFEMNTLSGHYGVKFYLASDPEPGSWLIERTTTIYPGYMPDPPQFRINAFWQGSGDRTISYDYIDIQGS